MRIAAAAGGPTAPSGATMAGGVGISRSYEGQVIGCIRPYIVFSVPETLQPKQHVAEFKVTLLPTGEQAGAPRLVKASGLPAFDQAVERANPALRSVSEAQRGLDAARARPAIRPGGYALALGINPALRSRAFK